MGTEAEGKPPALTMSFKGHIFCKIHFTHVSQQ